MATTLQQQIAAAQRRAQRAAEIGNTQLEQRNLDAVKRLQFKQRTLEQVSGQPGAGVVMGALPDAPMIQDMSAVDARGLATRGRDERTRRKTPATFTKETDIKGVFQAERPTIETTDTKINAPIVEEGIPKEGIPEDTRTMEEKARSLFEAGLLESAATEKAFFGESTQPTSIEEIVNLTAETQAAEKKAFERQAGLTQAETEARTGEQRRREEQQQQLIEQSLFAGGREGPESTTAPSTAQRLRTEMGARIDRLIAQQDSVRADIELQRQALKKAQDEAKFDLAQQIQSGIDAKQMELEQLEIDRINSLTALSAEDRAQQTLKNQSVQLFGSMLEAGIELSPEGIQSMATELGVDFETAFNYYNSAQRIRDDKSLDLAEKEVKLADLQQDFSDKIAGLSTEEAKKVDDFIKLSQSGNFSEEELQSFAIAMDIPDASNPVFQAQLQLSQAQAIIATKQANGEPITAADRLSEYEAQAALNQLRGIGGEAMVPVNSLEGITTEYVGGKLVITPATNEDGSIKPMQCGEFVNRTWGIAAGGAGGFGDTLAQKKSIIQNNGFFVEDMSVEELIANVKPGMAFVSSEGLTLANGENTGHVGIVTQVNADGTFVTMEANLKGDGNAGSAPVENFRNFKDGGLVGFAAPPNFEVTGSGTAESNEWQTRFDLANAGVSTQISTSNKESFESALATGDPVIIEATVREIERKKFNERTEPIVKAFSDKTSGFEEIRDQNNRLQAVWEGFQAGTFQDKGAVDQALITIFNKMLDPGSVVRESEFNRTPEGFSALSRAEGAFEKIQEGGVGITDENRQDLIEATILLVEGAQKTFDEQLKEALIKAENQGVPEEFLFSSLGLVAPTVVEEKDKLDIDKITTKYDADLFELYEYGGVNTTGLQ